MCGGGECQKSGKITNIVYGWSLTGHGVEPLSRGFSYPLPLIYKAKSQQGMNSFFYEGKTSTKTKRQEVN